MSFNIEFGRVTLRPDSSRTLTYTAYTRPARPGEKREVIFITGGGPGASAVFLHLGGIGPIRIELDERGHPKFDGALLTDYERSLLEQADLVFLDPPGTGFSPKDPMSFGVMEDVELISHFIREYLRDRGYFDRGGKFPVHLIGASYGGLRDICLINCLGEEIEFGHAIIPSPLVDNRTTLPPKNEVMTRVQPVKAELSEAGRLLEQLLKRHGDKLKAEAKEVLLQAADALTPNDLNRLRADLLEEDFSDQAYPYLLETYMQAAYRQRLLPPEMMALRLDSLKWMVELFLEPFREALKKQIGPSDPRWSGLLLRLHGFTGIPMELIAENHLRISPELFFAHHGLSRLDGSYRYSGEDSGRATDPYAPDVYTLNVGELFGRRAEELLRGIGGEAGKAVVGDSPYVAVDSRHETWNYYPFIPEKLDLRDYFVEALRKSPRTRVTIVGGEFDSRTPVSALRDFMGRLPAELTEGDAPRVELFSAKAGHFSYFNGDVLAYLKGKLAGHRSPFPSGSAAAQTWRQVQTVHRHLRPDDPSLRPGAFDGRIVGVFSHHHGTGSTEQTESVAQEVATIARGNDVDVHVIFVEHGAGEVHATQTLNDARVHYHVVPWSRARELRWEVPHAAGVPQDGRSWDVRSIHGFDDVARFHYPFRDTSWCKMERVFYHDPSALFPRVSLDSLISVMPTPSTMTLDPREKWEIEPLWERFALRVRRRKKDEEEEERALVAAV